MESQELTTRLMNAADEARLREDLDLADLLDEAEGELELALAIVEKVDSEEARAFMDRHSTDVPQDEQATAQRGYASLLQHMKKRFDDADWQRRLTMLLDAARFVAGRDTVPVDETLIAMAWNAPHPDMTEPDRVMRAGGFVRIGNEYRRLHNVGVEPHAPQR